MKLIRLLLVLAMLSVSFMSFQPIQNAHAQGSDCAPGFMRPPGASENTGCVRIIRPSDGDRDCDIFTDITRVKSTKGECIAKAYCENENISQTIRSNAGCNVASNNGSGPGSTSADPPAVIQPDCDSANVNKDNCGIIRYLWIFINLLSALVGIIIVIVIIVRGMQYIWSRNDPGITRAAKLGLAQAVLALVYYIFAYAFLQWVVPGGVF